MQENVVDQEKPVMPKDPDAGLKAEQHYVKRLPPWRYQLRQSLLPFVRWETPYLARFQKAVRSPTLDSYFAMTANLGTHTFFMIFLPILFWCGYTTAARALVHMLALGVFWSGWVKDLVCLPRPLSPPLQRITMSGSAALEYGFPSTHSTNAVSVAVYLIHGMQTGSVPVSDALRSPAIAACYCYAVSIIVGRMYCGMHGFSDVIIGTALGVFIAGVQITCGSAFDYSMAAGDWTIPVITTLVIFAAVRFHPEPADNCPCFDDSVSFAGTVVGVNLGHWHFAKSAFAWPEPVLGTIPFSLASIGWFRTALRLLVGVILIYLWRATAKPALLRSLPPIFRQIEYVGLSLPRRFFKRASQYKRVPPLKSDDNVIPAAGEIPAFFARLRSGRKRTISVGPQSEADARELLAQQEIKRKQSLDSLHESSHDIAITSAATSPIEEKRPTLRQHLAPPAIAKGNDVATSDSSDTEQERVSFQGIEKPRVRYDVEVVTKLVVYAGIGWLSVEWGPILFPYIGLGVT
ncbi:Dihydrosphingosine 1-phosphate phosphatase [Sphaceloma murrayae]|uniref:Dihydrosphingosine 1-phosphate phosphatase n=1 Tax=Sphaceloma murrayae TaxID=2082308 RepID=A0A2K1QU70_9PEZI|nr:Dihydrosphingosine 1-phosphate phosphatase [Sphaceloma murrayae]